MSDRDSMRVAVLILSDIEGSVALQNRVGTQAYARILARHNDLFRQAVEIQGSGRILNYTGDGFLAELPSPSEAVRAALRFQWLLNEEPWGPEVLRARTAVHLGEITEFRQEGTGEVRPVGMAINYVARLMELAAGGQILLSRPIWDDARRNVRSHPPVGEGRPIPELDWRQHGRYLFKGAEDPMEVFEVGARGVAVFAQPPDSPKTQRVIDASAASSMGAIAARSTYRERLLRPKPRDRKLALGTAAAVAIIGVICLLTGVLDALSYDAAFLFRGNRVPEEVVLVEMDNASSFQLNQPSDDKWDRRLHARLLENLHALGAKAVAFDVLFVGSAKDPAEDDAFRSALERTKIGILGAMVEVSQYGGTSVAAPNERFRDVAKWGIVERADAARAVRRPQPGVEGVDGITEIAARMALNREMRTPTGAWMNYYGPPGTIARRSYVAVLSNQVPATAFSNKVVFVGANMAVGYAGKPGTDYFIYPYTRWSGKEVPGVEVNATSYANLVRSDWLKRLPPWLEFLFVVLFGLACGYALVFLEPTRALLAGAAGAATLSLLGPGQVWFTHLWFPWLIPAWIQIPAALLSGFAFRLHMNEATMGTPARTAGPPITAGAAPATMKFPTTAPAIPDHEMLRRIGSGAYGEVWIARDVLGNLHAVKILYRSSFPEAGPYEREFEGLRRYTPISRSHPGFVHILHVGRNDAHGYIYYVMEPADDCVRGSALDPRAYSPKTLLTELDRSRAMPARDVARYGLAIAQALDHLHRSGLLHRDLKPANIIFVGGRLKLADIGLVAAIPTPGHEPTRVGTEGYMAPEGPGTPSADLYSLGKLMYVLLTRHSPASPLDFQRPHADQDPTGDAALLPGLTEVIVKLCAQLPSDRFASADDLCSVLSKLVPADKSS